MGKYRGVYADSDPGWIKREHRALWKAIKESSAAKRLQAATIGRGGITVQDGGSVTVKGGQITAEYDAGGDAIIFGPTPTSDGRTAESLRVMDEDGDIVFSAHRILYHADFPTYPDGQRIVQIGDVDLPVDLLWVSVGPGMFTMDSLGTITLDGGPSGGVKIGHGTTAEAANCFISTSGLIHRSTSSRRYKTDIADAEIDTAAVLQLVPRAFRTKAEIDELGDDAPVRVGFIAEEAADLGLEQWVTRDDEGPEAFSYASYCVALQAVAREQAEQIKALTARVDALEGN